MSIISNLGLTWPPSFEAVLLTSLLKFILGVACLYLVRLVAIYYRTLKATSGLLGPCTVLGVETILSRCLPPIPGISLSDGYPWLSKHEAYQVNGWDAYFTVSVLPVGYKSLWLSDPSAIKEVANARSRFPKPIDIYKFLLIFGPNIVASESHSWKRYRKIVAPAFSERMNKYVLESASNLVWDLLDNAWKHQKEVTLENASDVTSQLALFMISTAGFGRYITFEEDTAIPPGHQMPFKQAIDIAAGGMWYKLVVPTLLLKLHPRWSKIYIAFEEMEKYIREMIAERRIGATNDDRHDILSNLLRANEDGNLNQDLLLSDEELVANVFIFLLGGHEASAQALAFTFASLSLYPEEQEKLYQQLRGVMPDGRLPKYEDMPLLSYALAIINETIRMYPPVPAAPKRCAEDTQITITNAAGQKQQLQVESGTTVFLHYSAMHYNPRYWKDPHVFRPSRFLEDYPREAFLPFSSGPRACLGRKFFEIESVAILSLILFHYEVTIKDEPAFAHETIKERRDRIFQARVKLTLSPDRVPLTFKLRENREKS